MRHALRSGDDLARALWYHRLAHVLQRGGIVAHVHQWRVTHYTLLTLPDIGGFADRFTAWRCTACGKADALSGCIRMDQPLGTPEWWAAGMGVRTFARRAQPVGP
jgi:hypothetical protein